MPQVCSFLWNMRRKNQRRHRQRELDEIAELEAEADKLGMHLKVWIMEYCTEQI